jgi:hypothetical protein
MQAKKDPLLALDAVGAHRISEAMDAVGEIGVAIMPVIVDKSCLSPSASRQVAPDQIGCGVVCRDLRHRVS